MFSRYAGGILPHGVSVRRASPLSCSHIIWDKTLPGLKYPEEGKVYHVFGHNTSSSDLGNLNYVLAGKALGIPETFLLQQAGAAQPRNHGKFGFIKSEIKSLTNRDYGDEEQDQDMIKNGFDVYNS